MDELDRDLADGMLGWDQADRALSGDLAGAYRDEAAREVIGRQRSYAQRQPRPAGTVAGAALVVLALIIVVALLALG